MTKKHIAILILLLTSNLFGTNSVIIGLGTDNSMLTLNLGYRMDLNKELYEKDSNVTFGLKTTLLRAGLDDFAIYSKYEIETINIDNFSMPLILGINLKKVRNAAYNSIAVGPEVSLKPRFKLGDFGSGMELLWDSTFISYIRPTDKYLNYVNPLAIDGFYFDTSNSYRVGLQFDYNGLEGIKLFLDGGYQYSGGYSKVPPIYGFGGSEISL